MELAGIWLVLTMIAMVVIGVLIGLFLSRFTMKSYFKKNPPINEEMLASIMQGMGQTPNKKKINQMMRKLKNQ